MRTFVAGLLAVGLVVAFAGPSDAASKKRYRHYDGYAQKYPYATPRQLQNARAYDRGGYYEQDSSAHPVGSRGWWELKDRENSGRFRF